MKVDVTHKKANVSLDYVNMRNIITINNVTNTNQDASQMVFNVLIH